MEEKGFVEDGFIIDLSNAKDAAEIIYELSNILDLPDAKEKKICLKLGAIDLTQSQLLSIKSLINSMVSELAFVDTNSEKTELSALNLGIIVSELSNKIETSEKESDEPKIKEMEVGIPKDGLSYSLSNEEQAQSEVEEEETQAEAETEEVEIEIPEEEIPEVLTESKVELSDVKLEAVEIEEVEEATEEETSEDEYEEEVGDLKEAEVAPTQNSQVDAANIERLAEEQLNELAKLPTLYLKQTLRSGQTMSYDGNIVLIGDANPGSELIAKGDITVWGILGGIAHAGARGNEFAKIRALKLNAIQLRISGLYARRPDSVNIPFIQRSSQFTPEEARVSNKEIAIYKMYEG